MQTAIIVRWSKLLLLAAVALFFSAVVFNNITDFNSNYVFVRHTLSMDTTFPGNRGTWRAIHLPALHLAFYLTIIVWECLNVVLCWWGAIALFRARKLPHAAFQHATRIGVMALTAGLLLWFVAFECVGGEWFLMWQSHDWNGQEAAFRMFMMEAAVLILLLLPVPATADPF